MSLPWWMKFLQTSRIWVGCPRTLSGILCQAMSLCLSLCSTTVLICFPHHQSASSLRAGPAFSSLHSQDWQVASAYEMFVEKVATGIYVFLVTAVVESFPLHMFHKNTYLKKKKIFFFSVNGQPGHFIVSPFPVLRRHYALGLLPSGSHVFQSSLLTTCL